MSRKKVIVTKIKKYQQADDPYFPSFPYYSLSSPSIKQIIKKLVTKIMLRGEKSKAWKILYLTFEHLKKETGQDPLVILEEAVKELEPKLETKKKRLGGVSQLIPNEVDPERGLCLALRWLVETARKGTRKKRRKGIGRPMFHCLAQEIIKARQKTGEAFKKKEIEQQKAKDSIAFASFAYRS